MMPVMAIAIGAAAFLVTHAVLASAWDWFGGAHEPWFLNSSRAVAFTAAIFVLAGAAAAVVGGRARAIRGGALVGAGGLLAAIVVLFWRVGAGSIFPIAIAAAAIVLLASGVIGALVARPFLRGSVTPR